MTKKATQQVTVALSGLLLLIGNDRPPVGIWRSIGYGNVWVVDSTGMATFEVTTTTCLEGSRYHLAPDRTPAGELVFRADSNIGAVANDWAIRRGGSTQRIRAHTPGTLADVTLERLSRLPAACTKPATSTREATFELFTRTMAEQYAFFRERNVSWPASVRAARARLPDVADDHAFYQLLADMLAPLKDRHTDVTATPLGLRIRNGRTIADPLTRNDVVRLTQAAPERYLLGPADHVSEGRLQVGLLPDSIGYLRVTAEYGYASTGKFEDDSTAFEAGLATVLPRVSPLKRLVLDLRINGGGYDALARLFVSHFTSRTYPALIKRARSDPSNEVGLTPPWVARVTPAATNRFLGRMVVLIGPNTLSAGEVLGMMLIGRTPRPVFVGELTQGIFADELVRRLPNGWQFQLSNERYSLPDGRIFEGKGLPPDVPAPVYPPGERGPGARDHALEKALEILRKR